MRRKNLNLIFSQLLNFFGPQHWWPADTQFEVIVGAILTQNTSWLNVERAVNNLKAEGVLSAKRLYQLPKKKLAYLIRPAGYFNIKAKRLKNFINFLFSNYSGSLKKMFTQPFTTTELHRRTRKGGVQQHINYLRKQLLSVNGIGAETADSIILYAAELPIFVVDTYTKRVFSRHDFFPGDASYCEIQKFFMQNLPCSVKMFNEFHALIVKLGKELCLKKKPKCEICPIK